MAISLVLSDFVLVITAAVLFYAAMTDLKQFRIPNKLIIVLAGLFFLHAFFSGRWINLHWNLAVAAVAFCILLIFYARDWFGGGDVKILTVAFLWVGITCVLEFSLLLFGSILVHVAAMKLGWAGVQQTGEQKRIPFAPSVAAALIATFMLGCLQPNPYVIQLSGKSHNALSRSPGYQSRTTPMSTMVLLLLG
jgi:prepilin peptidase CpaA